jgi:hypothetical protein
MDLSMIICDLSEMKEEEVEGEEIEAEGRD